MLKDRKVTQGVLLAIIGAAMFSSKAIFVKLSYRIEIDTMTLLVMRMGFALPFYIFIAVRETRTNPVTNASTKDWIILIFIGLVGYYLASLLDFIGLHYISAGLERLILFLYPTITLFLTSYFFKRQITRKQVLAVLVAYIGVFVSFWDQIFLEQSNTFWLGALLVFASALSFSFYLVGSEKIIPKFGVVKFTSYCMVVSCLAVILHYNIVHPAEIFTHHWKVYALGFTVAIFNTVIPSFIISAAIARIGSAKTSALSSVGPVFVIFTAAFFLGEQITVPKVLGTVVVIFAIWIISNNKT